MMLCRPLETSQVENLSPIRVNRATPCVLCPVRTCQTTHASFYLSHTHHGCGSEVDPLSLSQRHTGGLLVTEVPRSQDR